MASSSVSKPAKPKKAQASAEDSSAFGPIAERFRRAGDLERAVSLCRDGLRKFPHTISARVTLGWALLELGKFDEAQVELEQVLRRRPDNLAAIRALAELHDRSEQTLNLPMDGPGQWPPTEDAVDEAATGAIAGSFGAITTDITEPSLSITEPQGDAAPAVYQPEPAVVAPPELGPAMWSALPPPEHTPAHARLVQVESVGVSDADIAAILAEAESLEAVAQAPVEPVADVQLEAVSVVQLEAGSDVERVAGPHVDLVDGSDVELDAGSAVSLDTLAAAQFAEAVEVEPAAVVLDAGSDLSMFEDAAYHTPAQFSVSVPDDAVFQVEAPAQPELAVDDAPGFQLEAVSIMAVEAETGLLAEMASVSAVGETAFDPDLQALFDFDAEPVVAAEVAMVAQPEPEFVPVEPILEPVAMVDPEVIVHIQPVAAAEAVTLEPTVEPLAVRSPIVALEGFLARVQSRRRQLMTESVA